MITLTCDACNQRFDVPDDAQGTTVKCPKCNEPNGVPNRTLADAPPPQMAASDPSSEQRLLYVRPAMFRARPARFSLFLLLALAGLGGAGYFLTAGNDPTLAIACGVGSLVGIVPLVLWKIASLAASLEITSRRTVLNRGLFSKTTTEVRHEDIKNFQVDQTFQQRIFNVGTIGISSSGQDDIEIKVNDVPKPYRVREIIDRHRRR